MHRHSFILTRHPELVSGSIGQRDLECAGLARPGKPVACEPMAPRRVTKWTLKQVQGDERAIGGKRP